MQVLSALRSFFSLGPRRILVAFSGGPDSLCLLWGLTHIASERGLEISAAHIDHGLDSGSEKRAIQAEHLAESLGVRCSRHRLRSTPQAGDSVEAWAREHRYRVLEQLARETGAEAVATGHHADDQAETVALRMLYGSGLEGLAAIRARSHGKQKRPILRPLLELRRQVLETTLETLGLAAAVDPTNRDLHIPRNRVRHLLLPGLSTEAPDLVEHLGALATAAAAANQRCETILTSRLALRSVVDERGRHIGAELDRQTLEDLPQALLSPALALLGRRAGSRYPAGAPARHELLRQLRQGKGIGCDSGHGWRWEGDRHRLRLVPSKPKTPNFAYTLVVPGEVQIQELDLTARLRQGRVASWMFRGRVDRAGLAADLSPGTHVMIRNRRPGDRIRPLGARSRLRVKDLLIARKIPRAQRDRLPLMVIDGEIAWIPGITIDERFRLHNEKTAWIAEIEPLHASMIEP